MAYLDTDTVSEKQQLTQRKLYIDLSGQRCFLGVSVFFLRLIYNVFYEKAYFERRTIMDITKKVAKLRFVYHTNMLDVCNVLNQFGILKDNRAEVVMKDHCMKSFDCMERIGLDVKGYFNKHKNKMES